MRCRVTRLRDHGRCLKRSEIPPPKVGDLRIFDRAPEDEKGRYTRQASLLGELVGQVRPNVFQPIFDVQVLRIDETGMYIQGREIHASDGGRIVTETTQVWLCQPVTTAPALPPADWESAPGTAD